MKNIRLSEVVRIVKPEYVYLKLTPSNSIRNQSTHKIAKTISSLYRNVIQNIKTEQHNMIKVFRKEFFLGTKYSFEVSSKVGYYIYIEKKKVEFYFIVPKHYLSIIKEKLGDVWSNVTVEQVEQIPTFNESSTKYQLSYIKEDGLSLATDRTNNDLLNSQLNVVDILEQDDRVGVFYNFIPTSQFSWRASYENTVRKVKDNAPVDRNKMGISYTLRLVIKLVSSIVDSLGEAIGGENKSKKEKSQFLLFERTLERMNGGKQISPSTTKKANSTIVNTQIVVLSESKDKFRERNNAKSLSQSFDTIIGDNRLVAKPYKKGFEFTDYSLPGAEINKTGDEEVQNFISLAGRDILEKYNFIDKVDTKETQVPEDLRKGTMRIGVNTFRGNKQEAYLTNHKEYQYLSLFLIGPTRSGKTTLIGNLSYDAVKTGECVILFDYIENCEMSTEVASLFPQDQVLNIVCDNKDKAQGLGYNEVRMSDDPFEQYTNAKEQTTQLMDLINAINTDDKRLAPKMERYFESAANVVFIQGGSIKDVFTVLNNFRKRAIFISGVKDEQYEYLEEYIESLNELDDIDSKTGEVMGTKLHLIAGIIDRLGKLKRNPYMELMLQKSTEDNIDLVEEMEKNQLICIKMPEHMFNTDNERDIYTTYWITKIWLSLQIRASLIPDKDKRKKVNLFIDEMYQVQNTEAFLAQKLSRLAKFRLKPIVSCHYLDQLKHIKKELSGANASYMLISGSDKDNFNELKDELHPYTVEDLLNLPEYHSLNYLKTSKSYGRFITKLPPPINEHKETT
ncbi:hypothetical protein V7138_14875 [Bacillus sp. JJ1533]|uniref:hypothetical protein n=1 Tax=Bacillus sp. JJ1533 TaxID=3122959 RepID=UPI002FFE22B6